MMRVRTVQTNDLDALCALAQETDRGLTSFKPDRPAFAHRIARVRRTIEAALPRSEQGYLFVMEETHSQRLVGVCALEVAVGLTAPFYNYRLSTLVHASHELHIWTKMTMLTISHDLTGCTELCSLFLSPHARATGNGALLSKSRLLFIALFPERFAERICAEMRGYFDEHGESPFWQAVGSHFYQIEFDQADYLSAHGRKSFVAELMPRYPVYVDLLVPEVRACIAKTHPDTVAARVLLETEGLRFENHVDIFDAGPVLEARIDSLRAVRDSQLVRVQLNDRAADSGMRHMVATITLDDFRVILIKRAPHEGVMQLTTEEAQVLGVTADSDVCVLSLYPVARQY